jgi:hypothetical protein
MTDATNSTDVAAATPSGNVDIFKALAVNASKAKDGVWVTFQDKTRFLIGYMKSRKFQDTAAKHYRKHEKLLATNGQAARDKLNEITTLVMAEVTLLGWENVDFNGQVNFPYNRENAIAMLNVDAFREWVSSQAGDHDAYKEVQVEEDAKN